ncbi:MAG: radical SAM protein, partial [Acutalibacteraceae bacterium]
MIHQYKLYGLNIVLDICSGSVHIVDDVAYDVIERFERETKEQIVSGLKDKYAEKNDIKENDIEECYNQVQSLKDSGKLFSLDTFEPMAGKLKEKSAGVIKALCLHVAHTCNLNCSYCFASQGKYHGERAVMSLETAKRSLDFLIENSGTRRNLEVDFFGGEPLMNFDVVKKTVEYARQIEKEKGKNFRFTLTTNGVLVDDEVIDFANREMSNVVLSLDGRKEVHDRFRVDFAGNGSFEKIVPKFQKLVKAR